MLCTEKPVLHYYVRFSQIRSHISSKERIITKFFSFQLLLSRKFVTQHASYSLIFNPLHRAINKEQHESISTINSAIMENTEFLIAKASFN